MHEGTVSDKLTHNVTHVVVYISSESPVSFKTILQRCVSIECISFVRVLASRFQEQLMRPTQRLVLL